MMGTRGNEPRGLTGVFQRVEAGILPRAEGAAGGEKQQKFEISFSSEKPYRRFSWRDNCYYDEILEHGEGAVDLNRLKDLGVVLFNHDRDRVIGRIEGVRVDGGRGLATIRFDEDAESQVIADKVRAGTLRGVSVGYKIDSIEEKHVEGRLSEVRATHWTPFEVSIVSVPADTSVGVGRSEYDDMEGKDMGDMAIENVVGKGIVMGEQNQNAERGEQGTQINAQASPAQTADTGAASTDTGARSAEEILTAERKRVSDISALCRDFDEDPSGYIERGDAVDAVRAAILEKLRARAHSVPSVQVVRDEGDKVRAAMCDALLMRGGMAVEKPADGARDFRGMSLRDMAIECGEREGMHGLRRLGANELYAEMVRYAAPTAAFPTMLDAAVTKAYTQAYTLAPTTFERFTKKGSLSDFKSVHHLYMAGNVGEFELVPEGGELKHDVPVDERLGDRALKTYGKQLIMTREAFINDDIGFISRLPAMYATSAKLTINRQVYKILSGNPTLGDGKALFHADHRNLAATAGALNLANLVKAMTDMTMQQNAQGNVLQVRPRYLIVPVSLGAYARMLVGSAEIRTTSIASSATNVYAHNPVYNLLEVVEDPELDAQLGSAAQYAWFLAADHSTAETIQIDYLSGQETPSIRRMERPGVLGYVWDVYFDWGISVLDYRGLYKNAGAAPTGL